MLLQNIFHTVKKCGKGGEDSKTLKIDGGGEMMLVYTITEINYLVVGLSYNFVRPFFVFIYVVLSTVL